MNSKHCRCCHLVGSLPLEDESVALKTCIEKFGILLNTVPDGEVGEKDDRFTGGDRQSWVQIIIKRILNIHKDNWYKLPMKETPVLNDKGFPTDFKYLPEFRPTTWSTSFIQDMPLTYLEYFEKSFPIFKKLISENNLSQSNMKFQVGIPSGLAISLTLTKSLFWSWWLYKAFNERIAFEVNEMKKKSINESGSVDFVVQIELPVEFTIYYQFPLLRIWAMESINHLISKIDKDVPIGFHICLGDINNKASVNVDTRTIVNFSNNLVYQFPYDRNIEFIHLPLGEGEIEPVVERNFYEPLGDLNNEIQYYAGFIHEKSTKENQSLILNHISDICKNFKYPVGVASSCGLGRRSEQVCCSILDDMKRLCLE